MKRCKAKGRKHYVEGRPTSLATVADTWNPAVTSAFPVVVCWIIAVTVPASYGLKCLSCSDVPNPRDCFFVQHCAAHEVCSTELIVTAIGSVRYKVGCKDSHTCGSSTVHHGGAKIACSQCCDNNELCNVGLCHAGGYGPLTTRGPVCFNCHSVSDPNSCDQVKVCGVDDACAIIEKKTSHSSTFDMACVTKRTICPTLHAPGTRTGCCDKDACTSATKIVIPPASGPGPVTSGCQDDPTCASLQTAYQGVHRNLCQDPTLSSTYCKKTCGMCSGGSTTNACSSNPCQHGTCSPSGTGYTCTCLPGYSGQTCSQNINDCASNPCRHGKCTDRVNDYICSCTSPYYGRQCMSADGNWAAWNHWTTCSATCGTGSQTRQRSCSNPAPEHGGTTCPGNIHDSRYCNTNPCPVPASWGAWGAWSSCTASCGSSGTITRRRYCSGTGCGGLGSQSAACNRVTCPVPSYWSSWGYWSACSVTCGSGLKYRTRQCVGTGCPGSTQQSYGCSPGACPAASNCRTTELTCNFDSGSTCGWFQNHHDDDFDWSMGSGSTDTPGTGPSSAHSGSRYLFIEASGRGDDDEAILISPQFCGGRGWCLSYYYYMHGRDVNSLSVKTNTGHYLREGPKLLHDKGSSWHKISFPLQRYTHNDDFNVRIRATVGKSKFSDIAIDDVRVYPC